MRFKQRMKKIEDDLFSEQPKKQYRIDYETYWNLTPAERMALHCHFAPDIMAFVIVSDPNEKQIHELYSRLLDDDITPEELEREKKKYKHKNDTKENSRKGIEEYFNNRFEVTAEWLDEISE